MRDGGAVTVAGYAALRYRHVPRGTVALLEPRATARHARRARRPVRGSGYGSVGRLRGGYGGVLSLPRRSRGAITARRPPAAHRFDRAGRTGGRLIRGAGGRGGGGRRRRLRQPDHRDGPGGGLPGGGKPRGRRSEERRVGKSGETGGGLN